MPKPRDPIRHLRRCIGRERKAARLVTTLTSWFDTDEAEKALAEAKRKTDQAMRYVEKEFTYDGADEIRRDMRRRGGR